MNFFNKQKQNIKSIAFLFTGLAFIACTFDDESDPNRPSLEGVLSEATVNQLNNLVVGVEATMRAGKAGQTTGSGTMARELYLFDADPRNTGDLLGANGAVLDNNSFYSSSPWRSRYLAVKNANILLEAINNTDAITSSQKAGYSGFAKTIIAHELIDVVKSFGKARVDVSDPSNLGPILNENEAFSAIDNMLDEAASDLNIAGGSFAFPLAGFDGFDSPSDFLKFNKALKAKAALYSGDIAKCLLALSESFLNLNGDLSNGPKHVFSLGSGDQTNGLYKIIDNNGDQIIVHNSFINDAEAGDLRVNNKTVIRSNPTGQDALSGSHQTALYVTNVSSIDIIRNEELVLIYAEAKILTDLSEAENAINIIRASAGLASYNGLPSRADLIKELLHQRRYSLWCENHRMYDLRRYNLSSTLPIDRAGDQVFNQFPVPLTENE